MREIKFRYWSDADNKMNYMPEFYAPDECFNLNILFKRLYDNETTIKICLMQSTLQKDKNGKEIWEGDILQSHVDIFSEVIWHNEHGGFFGKRIGYFNPETDSLFGKIMGKSARYNTVIGNIWENPELRVIKNESN